MVVISPGGGERKTHLEIGVILLVSQEADKVFYITLLELDEADLRCL
jgi:hypothetical protein